jgi:hypothetical protein
VVNRRLVLLATDKNWQQWIIPIDGYVHDSECPDATVVSIDASQLAMMKQSIATSQAMADKAYAKAVNAEIDADGTTSAIKALQAQMATMQTQVNYLYRLAFLAWPKQNPDADIDAYVDDLVALIRKVK